MHRVAKRPVCLLSQWSFFLAASLATFWQTSTHSEHRTLQSRHRSASLVHRQATLATA